MKFNSKFNFINLVCIMFAILFSANLNAQTKTILDDYTPEEKVELKNENYKTLDYLEKAYKKNSKAMLKIFFDAWAEDSKPISQEEFDNKLEMEKEVYKLFEISYVEKLNDSSNSILNDTKYLLLQNKIIVSIFKFETHRSKFSPKVKFDSIEKYYCNKSLFEYLDFRPKIKTNGKKVIFCTDDFLEALMSFITRGSKIDKINSKTIYMKKRIDFLQNFIQFNMPRYFDKNDIPSESFSIEIEDLLTEAIITNRYDNYEMPGSGSCTFLKKDNQWVNLRKYNKQKFKNNINENSD